MPEQLSRKSNIVFSELYVAASFLVDRMRTDAAEFASYGVDSAEIDAFESFVQSVAGLSVDAFWKADWMIALQNRDAIYSELVAAIKEIERRARIVFADERGKFDLFVNTKLYRLNDSEFLNWCRNLAANAVAELALLAPVGVTQAMCDLVTAKCDAFGEVLQTVQNAAATRKNETQKRVETANLLYDKVSYYCRIGKAIWVDRDLANYNTYLLYRGVAAKRRRAAERKKEKENLVSGK